MPVEESFADEHIQSQDLSQSSPVWPKVLAVIVGNWSVFALGIVSGLMIPITLVGLTYLLRRRKVVLAVAILILTPPTLQAMLTTSQYFEGTARLHHLGLRRQEFGTLDRHTRCEHVSLGCIPSGREWILVPTNNITLKVLTAVLGPMAGAYSGPYPTLEEAQQALEAADGLKYKDVKTGRFIVDGQDVLLDTEVGRHLVSELFEYRYHYPDPAPRPIKATFYQQQCLILSFPNESDFGASDSQSGETIVLIDRNCGRPFCYYFVGDWYFPHPTALWRDPSIDSD
ncbi:hypothetical protein AB1L30_12675 [Bremerella sp. JC817]|uniref:hypothetical protein n=1 Tax=Bremerella sp. JC817 TaxID=3231756 RepID=UPI00345B4A90